MTWTLAPPASLASIQKQYRRYTTLNLPKGHVVASHHVSVQCPVACLLVWAESATLVSGLYSKRSSASITSAFTPITAFLHSRNTGSNITRAKMVVLHESRRLTCHAQREASARNVAANGSQSPPPILDTDAVCRCAASAAARRPICCVASIDSAVREAGQRVRLERGPTRTWGPRRQNLGWPGSSCAPPRAARVAA